MNERPSRFDDGKEPGALRTIGEVASALDIRQHVLRYWEQHFPMLKPLKRSGGRRLYRPADIALLDSIDRMVNREGYTLRGARLALEKKRKDKPDAPEAGVEVPKAGLPPEATIRQSSEERPDVLPQLKAIRARLAAALDA